MQKEEHSNFITTLFVFLFNKICLSQYSMHT
uniref:Uncharacterized protein n=1 Tax=Arundo donax TaxID=35708 RepID=A0A0A9HD40_ARUDO